MKDAILTAITLCLSMFIIVMTIFILAKIGGFMFNDEAQAQTTMSASVQPNICNSNLDVIRACCE